MSEHRSMFNEATRVQMPALVHLTRLGYIYYGKITEDMAGTKYDSDIYEKLMDAETGLYRESPSYVYGLLQDEINFGHIVQAEV